MEGQRRSWQCGWRSAERWLPVEGWSCLGRKANLGGHPQAGVRLGRTGPALCPALSALGEKHETWMKERSDRRSRNMERGETNGGMTSDEEMVRWRWRRAAACSTPV